MVLNTAPWWGVPVIAGSFLLLGTVVGFLFNRANEDRKAKRDRSLRWDDAIRGQCAEVIVAARAIYKLAEVPGRLEKDLPIKRHIRGMRYVEDVVVHLDDLALLYASLKLIAPTNVVISAADLMSACSSMLSSGRGALAQSKELSSQVDAFVDVVREYLE